MDYLFCEPILGNYLEEKISEARILTPRHFWMEDDCWNEEVFKTFIRLLQADSKIKGYFRDCYGRICDNNSEIRTSLQATNFLVGNLSLYSVYNGKYLQWNELWHKTKFRGFSYRWQDRRWKNVGAKYWREQNIKSVANARKWSSRLTKVGGVLLAADILISKEVKPSHAINAAMLGASCSGVGSIIAGIWFVADSGVLLYNLAVYNENKSLGDIIDESIGVKYEF